MIGENKTLHVLLPRSLAAFTINYLFAVAVWRRLEAEPVKLLVRTQVKQQAGPREPATAMLVGHHGKDEYNW